MSIRCATCWRTSLAAPFGVAFASLLGSGCGDGSYRLGGASSEARSLTGSQRSGLCAQGADLEFIDQMEDGNGSIDFTAGRSGFWFAFNDKTGVQYPESDLPGSFPMSALERPRADSHYAARSYGSGFTLWGSGIGFDVRAQAAYDASAYAGISFWARSAAKSGIDSGDGRTKGPLSSALRVNVPDRGTSALGAECQASQRCGDDFGRDLELATMFQYFSFTWADLAQRGWSGSVLPKIDQAQIYGLRFQTDVDVDFDFWIDDVALLCH
jgi:hypothetical protein